MKTFIVYLVDFMGQNHSMKAQARSVVHAKAKIRALLREVGQEKLYSVKSARAS